MCIILSLRRATLQEARAQAPSAATLPAASPAERVQVSDETPGLHITNTVAGNPFGLRAGDVVFDLCDRPGAENPIEISAALAEGSAACLSIIRDGAVAVHRRR